MSLSPSSGTSVLVGRLVLGPHPIHAAVILPTNKPVVEPDNLTGGQHRQSGCSHSGARCTP